MKTTPPELKVNMSQHRYNNLIAQKLDKTAVACIILILILTALCSSLLIFSHRTTQEIIDFTEKSSTFFAKESSSIFREQGTNLVIERLQALADSQAKTIISEIANAQAIAETLATGIKQVAQSHSSSLKKRKAVMTLMRDTFEHSPRLSSLFTRWEPNAFGTNDTLHRTLPISRSGSTKSGLFSPFWLREKSGISLQQCNNTITPTAPIAKKATMSYYDQAKEVAHPFTILIPPAITSGPESGNKSWHLAVIVPLYDKSKFEGICGAALTMDALSSILSDLDTQHFGGKANLYILTAQGMILASSEQTITAGTLIPAENEEWSGPLASVAKKEPYRQRANNMLTISKPLFPEQQTAAASLFISLPDNLLKDTTTLISQTISAELRFLRERLHTKRAEQNVQQAIAGLLLAILTLVALLLVRQIDVQQRRLKKSEETLNGIIRNTSNTVFVKDLEGRYIQANPSFEHTVDLTESEILGKSDYDIFPKTLADKLHEHDCATLEADCAMQWEESIATSDGIRCFITTKFPLHDSKGKASCLCGIAMDITERHEINKEKENLKRHLSELIDSIPSIIIGVDNHAAITLWNRRAEDLFAISRKEAIGKELASALPLFAEQLPHIKEAIHTLRPQKQQQKQFVQDGKNFIITISIFPLRSDQRAEAVMIIEDITKQTRIEEIMIQTEKMLSVGGLAAGMAHEINNPLGAILQGAQNIDRRLSPDIRGNHIAAEKVGCSLETVNSYLEERKIRNMLQGIREAGERAARIVQNMLNFSRKSESVRDLHDITLLSDNAIELARSDYDLNKNYDIKQATFIKAYPPHPARAVCIHTEIEQVLLNLFKNSAQAMANGQTKHPTITVTIQNEFSHISITVDDNGPGMSEATRKRVFEPFFTTKAPGTGTGLGLSVSYFIITQNHGGTFTVSSEQGAGTTFTIRLPIEGFQPSTGV